MKASSEISSDNAQTEKQQVVITSYDERDFKTDGLRAYAAYRDLGIAAGTHGLVQAHVLRFTVPFNREVMSKLHYHGTKFQMIYVLKGWIKAELEGVGEQLIKQGGCYTQPPYIKHKVKGYSDDCEVLEIIMPAEFETVELEK